MRTLPKRMEFETFENKKEGYIALVAEIVEKEEALLADFSLEKASEYMLVMMETLKVTSPEIYEHYRRISDSYRKVAFRALTTLFAERDSFEVAGLTAEMAENMGNSIRMACESRVILAEKYEEIGKALIRYADAVKDGASNQEMIEKAEAEAHKAYALKGGVALHQESEAGAAKLMLTTGRSATFAISDGGVYETKEVYDIFVNGVLWKETTTVVTSIFHLMPSTGYVVSIKKKDGSEVGSLIFDTKAETATINVKDLGAKGDGIQDDTSFIQAAILSCPKNGRVLIPEGIYYITSIFMASDISIELAKGAELRADRAREKFVHFPALLETNDEMGEIDLGTWEGNPLPMFAGIVTGIRVDNVVLYGEGVVNGNASKEDWWNNPKVMRTAFRPRTFFINHCNHITVQGIKFCNSPSWTIHPYFSNDLKFYNVCVENPSDSPNTDGLDPESCKDVEIAGVRFTLGDDCIAIKAGKIYMGKKFKQPSENLHIHQCLMENGHGAVTIGSEMAGGVKNLLVENCIFRDTDRGLRIKTRRGRGEDAVIDQVAFRNIKMDHVMTPFVANSFYFCDPDGKTEYVQSRELYPVDDRTPWIKRMEFTDIDAKNCHVAAAYFEGLPERKIEEIYMENVRVTYAKNPKCDVPAMSSGVEACSLKGIFANNICKMTLKNVSIEGQDGPAETLLNVDEVVK